jgi:hypothetical protein
MPTDANVLASVVAAFGDCPRPEHFTDFSHCEECADHDELLQSRDRSTLSIADVGNPGWDPVGFCTPQGMAYYMPALARLSLDEPTDEFGWYGSLLVFHLGPAGNQRQFYEYCSLQQRASIALLLGHFIESRGSLSDFDVGEIRRALESWGPSL